jgi:hypothetical protein
MDPMMMQQGMNPMMGGGMMGGMMGGMGGMMPGMMGGGYGQMPFGPLQGAFSSLSDAVSPNAVSNSTRCVRSCVVAAGLIFTSQVLECHTSRATNSLPILSQMVLSSHSCRSRKQVPSLASESLQQWAQFGGLTIRRQEISISPSLPRCRLPSRRLPWQSYNVKQVKWEPVSPTFERPSDEIDQFSADGLIKWV